MKFAKFVQVIVVCLASNAVAAHEFWIEPQDYTVDVIDTVVADFRNGQNFNGVSQPFVPGAFSLRKIVNGQDSKTLESQLGERPAFQSDDLAEGLNTLILQTKARQLNYSSWAKFEKFVMHKDLGIDKAAHLALGYPEKNFQERYFRFAKSLIGVGSAKGQDRHHGLTIELVALANPYTDVITDSMPVQAFYNGASRGNAQIELFDRSPSGRVKVTLHRTNDRGVVNLPVKSGHSYLVDTVVLRQPTKDNTTGVAWESLWASLTFAVP